MKYLTASLALACVFAFDSGWAQGGLAVTAGGPGVYSGNRVNFDHEVIFTVSLQVTEDTIEGLSNGFAIYIASAPGPASAADPTGSFTTPTITVADLSNLGGGYGIDEQLVVPHSVDGLGVDTFGVGGFSVVLDGLLPGFGEAEYVTLTTRIPGSTQNQLALAGKWLCIDSVFYPPGGIWHWAGGNSGEIIPSWGGPYCFQIYSCCHRRGDVNYDESVDVSDLIQIVTYLFRCSEGDCNVEIYCIEHADIDGNRQISVGDITSFVAYLFGGGPAPATCP